MRAQVKTKKLTDVVGNMNDLADMFNQMIGLGNNNIHISYNKYNKLKSTIDKTIELFEILPPVLQNNPEMCETMKKLTEKCKELREHHAKIFVLELSKYEWNLSLTPKNLIDNFSQKYSAIKESQYIKDFMFICNNLWSYKKYIENKDNLNYKFILNMAGVEWCPLVMTDLNVKYLMSSVENANFRSFMISFIHKLFVFCNDIYDIIHTPDIDVEQLGDKLIDSICSVEKIPELNSKCNLVFAEIRKNIDLFKKNFSGYYRNFLQSKNNMSILLDFIIDIGQTKPNDIRLMTQIKHILRFYKTKFSGQFSDPRLAVVIDRVNDSLDKINEGLDNVVNDEEVEIEEDEVLADPVSSCSLSMDDIK